MLGHLLLHQGKVGKGTQTQQSSSMGWMLKSSTGGQRDRQAPRQLRSAQCSPTAAPKHDSAPRRSEGNDPGEDGGTELLDQSYASLWRFWLYPRAQGTGGLGSTTATRPTHSTKKYVAFLPQFPTCKGILQNFPSCTLWLVYLSGQAPSPIVFLYNEQRCKVQISNVVPVCNIDITY